ncbi:serine hydrolase domain-containing protein [Streptomonospora wellingtoniae]|uniref:Serine hydrolase domain-containing protein n=1 Tax=Streptomonospora wellingtoniae TaxID=3075544 RepID=A0ABU2KRC6_9ACTN|nr:serine hydrolase domain-containing protein [Streptomonospora sp. DSM 45055]MDT0301815.1 serine hydrolase domain-containing protein [Streptomonospora sp. DSM 45055]
MPAPPPVLRACAALLCGVLLSVAACSPARAAPAGPAAGAASIDAYLRERMAATGTPGLAYALVGPDGPEHTAAWGRDGDGAPITEDTPFLWGSVAKPVTATLVMSLAESGLLSPDDRVREHLPGFTLAGGAGGGITLRHLLAQTSGIPAGTGATDRFDSAGDPYGRAVPALAGVEPLAAPGTRHVYASENYLLLGAVVEAVTGRPFAEVQRRRVLEPLGMTGAITTAREARAVAPGHRYVFGRPVAFDAPYDAAGASYGYLGGSVVDLARFAAANLGAGRKGDSDVLSAASFDRMHTGQARISATHRYGLGWRADERNRDLGVSTVWHGGGVSGYQAAVVLLPERARAVVVVQNAYGGLQDAELIETGLGAARMAAGGAAPDASVDGWTYPALLAVLCAVLAAALTLVGASVRRLRRAGGPARRRSAVAAAAWALGGVVAAWSVAVPLPRSAMGVADLRRVALWQPDAAGLLAAVAAAALMVALLRAAAAARILRAVRAARTRQAAASSRPRL